MKSPRGVKLPKYKSQQISLSYYCIVVSSFRFFDTYYAVFVNLLQRSTCACDLFFLFKTYDTKISGTPGLTVTDSVNIGSIEYWCSEENATLISTAKKDNQLSLQLLRVLIYCGKEILSVSQPEHIERLCVLDSQEISPNQFCSIHVQLLFISKPSGPGIFSSVTRLYQARYDDVKEADVILLSKTLKKLQNTKHVKHGFDFLDSNTLKLYVFFLTAVTAQIMIVLLRLK